MTGLFLAVALLPQQPATKPLSPAEIHTAALADAQALGPAAPAYRYLSLATIADPKERERWTRLLRFHCNSLSTEADVVALFTHGPLLRVNLSDYGWSPTLWEQLAEVEPYYHVRVITEVGGDEYWPGGYWPRYRQHVAAGWYATGSGKAKKTAAALAPWAGPDATRLATLTGSVVPVVDGRWFLWQTAIQADRKPGYYDFLGIKDKAGFDGLVGYDEKLAAKAKRVELLEAVADSTVTLQARRIGAFPAISGTYWQTFDNREAVNENNPLRILNGGLRFDAMEVFGHLPNGLMVWGLFDNAGARQDTAPDFVASDSTAHGTDRRVHPGLSCVRCHGLNGGVQPVDGWARNLFKGPLTLQSPDYEKLKELRQKYLRDLTGPMEQSRREYARAVKEACGLDVKDLAVEYGAGFAEYDGPVSLERAAADAGLTADELAAKLRSYLKRTGSVDTVAATFLSGRKGGIRPAQYHEAFSVMMLAISGENKP